MVRKIIKSDNIKGMNIFFGCKAFLKKRDRNTIELQGENDIKTIRKDNIKKKKASYNVKSSVKIALTALFSSFLVFFTYSNVSGVNYDYINTYVCTKYKAQSSIDISRYNSDENQKMNFKYSDNLNYAMKWWTDELGYNPFNQKVKVIWDKSLPDGTMGLTTTPNSDEDVSTYQWNSYLEIDTSQIKEKFGDKEFDTYLNKILTHELGHYLGLEHKDGTIESPYLHQVVYKLTTEQKGIISNLQKKVE